jgi:protein-S-isoprenylcysteine O-methyltransferase Ste14
MYGFPLTIYLLSGWRSAHFPQVNWLSHDAGHLLEMMFGWRADPHAGPFHVLSFAFILGGFWLLSASWRVLYAAQKHATLACTGPYAHFRHSQYVAFVLVMFPVMGIAYIRLAYAEERDSEARFGDAYRQYAAQTPRFIPHLSPQRVKHA